MKDSDLSNEPVRFSRRVLATVRRIPYGKVSSYGDVAALVGQPRAARGVGRVLSQLPPATDVPWWRVVNRSGALTIPHIGRQMQRLLLEQEGVTFASDGRLEMRRYRWDALEVRERRSESAGVSGRRAATTIRGKRPASGH